MKKMSHYPAGYSAGGDHTMRDPGDRFRTRAQAREDEIAGFDGLQQGLSSREPMTSTGRRMQFLFGSYIP